jgi:tRNA A-37 threonylcarbamoyl transferase component Bud32
LTPERWQKVCQALDELLLLEPGCRELRLGRLRQEDPGVATEVASLLRQQDTPRVLDLDGAAARMWQAFHAQDELPPSAAGPLTQIGPYTLQGQVGKGGMGVVWRARDRHFRRSLAVKVLAEEHRANVDLRRRFLEEAQLMGQLQHPGIPPVHDLGELPDGRPYFAMKLIKGKTLAALLNERASPDQDHPRLLAIFEHICQTLAYAHAQGIVHRDLKPANVMVGAFGEVQVMDWGLAKVVAGGGENAEDMADPSSTICTVRTETPDAATQAGQAMGTPAYMAPEQARGEVMHLDERCDVFGLGGILCDILTGKPPFAANSTRESHRLSMKGELSEAFARLEGCGADAELLALAKRCLAANSSDRPAHAGEVAKMVATYQDLVRVRLHEAEVAKGQAQVRIEEERKRLLVERQKRRVTLVLAGAVLLVLLAGIGATTLALLQAWEQTDRAETAEADANKKAALAAQRRGEAAKEQALAETRRQQAEQQTKIAAAKTQEAKEQAEIARKVKEYLINAFRQPDPYVAGDKVTVAEVLKQAVQEIDKLDQPLLQEELLVAIGQTYLNLKLREAVPVWEKVVAFRTKRLGPDHPDTLTSMNDLAGAYQADSQLQKALPLLEETLEKRKARLGADHPATLQSMSNLAGAYQTDGQLQKALPLLEETLEKRKAQLGADDPDTLHSMNNLAGAYFADGQVQKALPLLEETLEKRKEKLGTDHLDTLGSMNNLASAYQADGQLTKAQVLFKETLAKRKVQLGPDHPDTLNSMNNLAGAYYADGQLQKALSLLEETLEKRKAKLGPDHADTLASLNNLAGAYQADGQLKKALPLFEQTLAKRKVQLGPDHPDTLTSINNLASAYFGSNRPANAEPLFAEWIQRQRPKLPTDDLNLALKLNLLGECRVLLKKFAEAEAPLRDSLHIYQKKVPNGLLRFDTESLLGASLAGQKQFSAAEPLLVNAVKGFQGLKAKLLPGGKKLAAAALDRLIDFYEAWGKPAEAAKWRALRDTVSDTRLHAIRCAEPAADVAQAAPLLRQHRQVDQGHDKH